MAGASTFPTGTQIIQEALGHLGVYAPGDPLDATSLASAFFTLQAMVDGYGAQPLLIFNRSIIGTMSTTAGKQTYTVAAAAGAGVDWAVGFLPPKFDLITMWLGSLEIQVGIDTVAEWERIGIKSLQSNIMQECYPNYGVTPTTHQISFYPCPNNVIPVSLYLLNPVSQLTSPTQVIQLPPQWWETITFELTVKLSSKFGAPVPSWIPDALRDAKANIKANNFDPIDVFCDPALVKRGGPSSGGGSIDFYIGR